MVKLERSCSEFGDAGSLVKPTALSLINTMVGVAGAGGEELPVLQKQKSVIASANVQVPQERVPALPVLIFAVSYITLGAVLFSAWEQWTFLEGFYFSFITLTTIGKTMFGWLELSAFWLFDVYILILILK